MSRIGTSKTSSGKLLFFLLIGTFLLLAPISVSGARSRDGDDFFKWARVIALAVIAVYGLQWFRLRSNYQATTRLLLFAVFFTVAAAWSTSPLWGLAFKGMFLASTIGGITLGLCLNSEADYRSLARVTTITAVVALGGVSYHLLTQTDDVMLKGRLWIAEINPNLLAQSATVFALLCSFHLLVPDNPRWKSVAGVCLIAMLAITILSGSRGASLMLLAGMMVLLPALGRQRRQVLILASVSTVVLFVVSNVWFNDEETIGYLASNSESDITLRIVDELTKDTRGHIWQSVFNRALKSPLIGSGWLHRNNRGSNVQSAYLQVFAEAGIIGVTLLAVFLVSAIQLVYQSLKIGRRYSGLARALCFVSAATAAALLLHGVFESSLVTGASPNAIILGFCIAQMDQLRVLSHRRAFSPRRQAVAVPVQHSVTV